MVIVINIKDTRSACSANFKKIISKLHCMYIVGLVKEEICSYKKKIKFRISGEKMALSIPIPLEKIEE